jgi:hypothetical protein
MKIMNKYQLLSDEKLASLCVKHGVNHLNVDIIVRNIEVELRYEFDSIELFFGGNCIETFAIEDEEKATNSYLSYLQEHQKIALELNLRCYNEQVQHDRKAY